MSVPRNLSEMLAHRLPHGEARSLRSEPRALLVAQLNVTTPRGQGAVVNRDHPRDLVVRKPETPERLAELAPLPPLQLIPSCCACQ
ncbi:MAG: hypothetical protein E6G04_06160 [Actinobacteria bacterium]|nr:MAG: hypothetical protein E6G04_06160 [Actinomycetota bacterium]